MTVLKRPRETVINERYFEKKRNEQSVEKEWNEHYDSQVQKRLCTDTCSKECHDPSTHDQIEEPEEFLSQG